MSTRLIRAVAPVVALLFAVALAMPVAAQRPVGHGRYDAQIQQEVTQKLQSKDKFKDMHASVQDGIVNLTGTVKLYRDKLDADRIAHHVEHAQGVRNEIVVQPANVNDAQLQKTLSDKLRYDRIDQGITFNNFEIGVNRGVVTISGQARTPTDKDSALSIVENAPGVTDVIDNIKVLPTSPFDDELRLRVARAVYGAPPLQKYAMDPQAPIRIVVDHGNVTLYGVVDSALDEQVAEAQARSVPGVFQVTNKLVVAGQNAAK
jgi:osmotically-inducible protein OsmY